MKTLYLTDLDGTFLNENAEVSNFSAQTVNYLIEKGCLFSIATARTFATVMKIFKNVKLNIPQVFMNGVLIYDPIKKVPVCVHSIEKAAGDEILKIFESQGKSPMLYFEKDGLLTIKHCTEKENVAQNAYLNQRKNLIGKKVVLTNDLSINEDDKLIYIVSIDEFERSNPLYQQIKLSDKVSCTYYRDNYTNAYFLETICKDVSKASGALMLKKLLGVDKIVAFGDNLNDLPIFEIADECYAVENACQEVKDKATAVIGTNTDDSVAKFLLQRFERGEL